VNEILNFLYSNSSSVTLNRNVNSISMCLCSTLRLVCRTCS